MLKQQTITNVWKCDECGKEITSEGNPFFTLNVKLAALPASDGCNVDLCSFCIQDIRAQDVADYVASLPIQAS